MELDNFKKKYFDRLNALRFCAFLMVFISHIFVLKSGTSASSWILFLTNHARCGFLGLDFFFVLSGFLITWIIFEENYFYQNFDWKNFFFRRTLRIWPLYFLIVLIGFSASFYFSNSAHPLPSLIYFLSFTLNFYIVKHGADFLFFLVFLWSIAVEEQFYIFWSLTLKFFSNHAVKICFLILVFSLFFRYYFSNNSAMLYFHSFSVMADFAIGSLFAISAFRKNKIFVFLKSISKNYFSAIYFLLILNIFFYDRFYSNMWMIVFEKLIFSTLFALIIFDQSFRKKTLQKNNFSNVINYLGKISFGLYCYHGIVITIFSKLAAEYNFENSSIAFFILKSVLIFAVTVIVSAISYEYFEKFFLQLKNKFYPQRHSL
ncbi:MAG: acyltransferase [Bacteroidia bacterium]